MLYTGSGSPIPNDKPMEQFKASDKEWEAVEGLAKSFGDKICCTILELRDSVAALAAKRAPEESSAAAPAATVPSDKELIQIWDEAPGGLGLSLRVVWDHGYAQGLAAGRAEQGSSSQGILDDSTPDPEPSDFQTLHGIALGIVDSLGRSFHVLPEILDTLRRAIREPMAQQQAAAETTHPSYASGHGVTDSATATLLDAVHHRRNAEPEPSPSPAEDAGLVRQVAKAIGGDDWEIWGEESRDVIRIVARWLRSMGNFSAATNLEQEANR
jgi:hypothetical protein